MEKVKAITLKVNRETKEVIAEQSTGDKFRYDEVWSYFQVPLIKDYDKIAYKFSSRVAKLWNTYATYSAKQDAQSRILEALSKLDYNNIQEVEITDELYRWFPSTSNFMRMYLIEVLGSGIKDSTYLSVRVSHNKLVPVLKDIPARFDMLKAEAKELLDFLKGDEDFADVSMYYIQGDDIFSGQRQFMYLWNTDKEKAQIYFINRFISRGGYDSLKGFHSYDKFERLVFDHIETNEDIEDDMLSLFGNKINVVNLKSYTFHRNIMFKDDEPYFFVEEEKYFYNRNLEILNSLPDVFASGGVLFTKSKEKEDRLLLNSQYNLRELKYYSGNCSSSAKGIYISNNALIDYNMPLIKEMLEEDYEALRTFPTLYKLTGKEEMLRTVDLFFGKMLRESGIEKEEILEFADDQLTQEELHAKLKLLMSRVIDDTKYKNDLFVALASRTYTTNIFKRFPKKSTYVKKKTLVGKKVYYVESDLRESTHSVVVFEGTITKYQEPRLYLESGEYVLDNYFKTEQTRLPDYILEFEGMDEYKVAEGIFAIPNQLLLKLGESKF